MITKTRSALLIAILSSVAFLVLPACADSDSVWGIPNDTFHTRVSNQNYAFLKHLDYESLKLSEIYRLGEGSAYYTAHILRELEMPEVAERLFRLSVEQGSEPWRGRSVAWLLREYDERGDYEALLSLAERAGKLYPQDRAVRHAQLSALYELERDGELLSVLAEDSRPSGGSGEASASSTGSESAPAAGENGEAAGDPSAGRGSAAEDEPAPDPRTAHSPGAKPIAETAEGRLWRAVARYRTDRPGWRGSLTELYAEHTASIHQSRVYLFIINRPDLHAQFSEAELALFRAKHFLSEGRYVEAFGEFQTYAAGLRQAEPPRPGSPEAALAGGANSWAGLVRLLTPETVRDIGVAALGSQRLTLGLQLLGSLERELPDAARSTATHYRGRLLLARGDYGAARRALSNALAAAGKLHERDRVLRNYIMALVRGSPQEAAVSVGGLLREASDRARFDGVLEELAHSLVSERHWEGMLSAYRDLRDVASEAITAQYGVIVAEAVRSGYLDPPAGTDEEAFVERVYRRAAEQHAAPYYAMLARVRLENRTLPAFDGAATDGAGEEATASGVDTADEASGGTARAGEITSDAAVSFVDGFFRFGLRELGYREARRNAEHLSDQTLFGYARSLGNAGNFIHAMRLMDVAARRNPTAFDEEAAKLRYPHAFYQHVRQVAEEHALPLWVFYGLVREESYFDADIRSHAGAVGLTQLMPSTAADVARRLDIEDPELTDPVVNLRIGGYHLSWLRGRFNELTPALFAYNAGGTRVRSWEREHGDLPGLLFAEAVPFSETRNYIRKVLVSAVYYGYLYGDVPMAETVQQFFPNY